MCKNKKYHSSLIQNQYFSYYYFYIIILNLSLKAVSTILYFLVTILIGSFHISLNNFLCSSFVIDYFTRMNPIPNIDSYHSSSILTPLVRKWIY